MRPRRDRGRRTGGAAVTRSPAITDDGGLLSVHQRLPTSGARTALPFRLDGALHLAVPQLAEDSGQPVANMNGGDSDTDLILYRWEDGRFVEDDRLAVPGGEDALVFVVGDATFLATASVRTGGGPYEYNAISRIFRRDGDRWRPFQDVGTFAAKQWHHFAFDGRHFLGLAQGVTVPNSAPRVPRHSCILEWRDGRFEPFQTLAGGWGYNFAFAEIGGERLLAYADHTSPSLLYRWDKDGFVEHQVLAERGGRAFRFFAQDGADWLAFATIDGDSTLYRWDGAALAAHQTLGVPGGREFELIRTGDALHLVRIRFIEGTPHDPRTDLTSEIFRWAEGGFTLVARFPTFGGTDATAFEADGTLHLAVSNSLTADIRFRQDTIIYRFDG